MYVKWSSKKVTVPSVVGIAWDSEDRRRVSIPVSKYVVLALKCKLSLYAANKSKVVEVVAGCCSWSLVVKSRSEW